MFFPLPAAPGFTLLRSRQSSLPGSSSVLESLASSARHPALVISYYDGYARTKVLGYQAASMGLGVLILETSGGFLACISWRAAFLIYLIGVVIFLGILFTMREPARPKMAGHGHRV